MKLNITTDFTKFPRAGSVERAGAQPSAAPLAGTITLPHDERHLRRKVLTLTGGERVFVDLAEPVQLAAGDRLVLDDGRHVEIAAGDEEIYEIVPRDTVHLAELAWHIGNRHLAAAIRPDRIFILRDHVIKAMLEGLGATVNEVLAPFDPVRGAYSGGHDHGHGHEHHDHDHGHGHHDHHDHDHDHDHHHGAHDHRHGHDHHGHDHKHGELDRFGRRPGDPHYGHNHA
ncbi:urease accessory protein UreE [Mesorhizobium sp. LHD-90]|uniref:urease accessory protein UreE n=1 Tax=Mesorhizobium sp. LHD-90 TaxID=3071414 RepID=UPI0027DFFA3E|nr:urease accessory protein UreE [Mesorhizobium sp. LHD-90]MDQ6435822.1 urease accessory protein UreE [Mesorhizobium sp. LHD-90]